jgi:hypothetical protein
MRKKMKPQLTAKYRVLLSALIVAAGFCAYAAIFYAWWVECSFPITLMSPKDLKVVAVPLSSLGQP